MPGVSKKTKTVGVRLPNDLLEELDAVAEKLGQSRSSTAVEAIRRGLETLRNGHTAPEASMGGLERFSRDVLESARRCRLGRVGSSRVFINHVFRAYKRRHRPKGMDLEAFKLQLVVANRARYLSLARDDMAPTHEPRDVETSETRYLSATFHFVCI